MNRLQREVRRLYAPPPSDGADDDADEATLIDASGRVRALVLQLARPPDWDDLSKVWHGVQTELELPAPAIAVCGDDGYQLWFSLAEPMPAREAMAFLDALRVRYLGDLKPHRVTLLPTVDASSPALARHARRVPAPLADSGLWSAFVAPDLAPVFADEPWLDLPPNMDGQSNLLSALQSIQPADFEVALQRLGPATAACPRTEPGRADPAVDGVVPTNAVAGPAGEQMDPKRFLRKVMNDESVALGLRIEAAKALLPFSDELRRP